MRLKFKIKIRLKSSKRSNFYDNHACSCPAYFGNYGVQIIEVLLLWVNPCSRVNLLFNVFVVIESPLIRKDLPLVRTVKVHQSVSLTVQAQGTGFTYQWTKDGAPLTDEDDGYQGVSTSSLTMRQASLDQSGEYQCVVENEGGCVWSSTCKVTVGEIA